MTVDVASGSGWQVAGQSADGTSPQIDATDTSLQVRSPERSGPFWVLGKRDSWGITLPQVPTLDVRLQLNAGSASVDLGGAALGDLDVTVNAGSATIDLTSIESIDGIDMRLNAGSIGLTLPNLSMTGSIQANAGSVKLCAPPGAGLRLRTGESIIAGYDYAGHGLVQDGTTWTTPGFETRASRSTCVRRANAGSFVLDPEGGCG